MRINMKRKNIVYLAFLIAGLSPLSTECSAQKPNILYIFTDDQSYRTISAYEGSHDWASTPNIDQLAKDGVRFTFRDGPGTALEKQDFPETGSRGDIGQNRVALCAVFTL